VRGLASHQSLGAQPLSKSPSPKLYLGLGGVNYLKLFFRKNWV